jgi:hypothetical protein
MLNLDAPERVMDLVIVPSPYGAYHGAPKRPEIFFDRSYCLYDDVWLADFDGDFVDAVMDACSPRGENFNPVRQYGGPYGFIRVNAPEIGTYRFDADGRLAVCVGLSRLAFPTAVGFQYAARIRTPNAGARIIAPMPPTNLNPYAFVSDERSNWLIPDDVPLIRRLVESYFTNKPTARIGSALWQFETAFRSYYVDTRWPLLVTGLEALVHIRGERDPKHRTRHAGSTRVFAQRLAILAARVGQPSATESVLRNIYDRRSTLVHGQGLGQLDQTTRELYDATEQLLAGVLRTALLEPEFSALFASDAAIQAAFPLS